MSDVFKFDARVVPSTAFPGANTGPDGRGTCTAANTAYIAVKANARRLYLCITAISGSIVVNVQGDAWNGSELVGVPIDAGDSFVWDVRVPIGDISVASGAAGATYFLTEA